MSATGPIPESLLHEFEQLDLSPYEARVLLALLRLGSANTANLARQSGVPRTSTYQVLEELNRRGLAQRVSVEGPAVWASPGREDVFARLDAAQEEKLRQHRARTVRLRELVAETFPEKPDAARPYVHCIEGYTQVVPMFDRVVASVTEELLVFNRGPYSKPVNRVNQSFLEVARRGASCRALYEERWWTDPGAAAFRSRMTIYHEAGVDGRLVAELPTRLVVADRRVALIAMSHPSLHDEGFPTSLLVEHPGFAALQAEAFERIWESAKPIVDAHRPGTAGG